MVRSEARRSDEYVLTAPLFSGISYPSSSNRNRHAKTCKSAQVPTGGASHSSASQSHPYSNGAVAGDGRGEYGHGGDEYGHDDDDYGYDNDDDGHDDDDDGHDDGHNDNEY